MNAPCTTRPISSVASRCSMKPPTFSADRPSRSIKSTHQAMLLRTARAAASSDNTKAQDRLPSGQPNRYSSTNSRGSFVTIRMNGEMLDRKFRIAWIPTNQPKNAGTQRHREVTGGRAAGRAPIPGSTVTAG
ncbi:Uncharacterised protein [Mycobacteroides abscessus subsp. abscessus]|nr:Uncharacterised protein [Mycobacteroides abscessus subsp. abscessus]